MSAPFDLSDALKTPPTALKAKPLGGGPRLPLNTRLDDLARRTLWLSLLACALLFVYLSWGLFAGAWTNPTWNQQSHAFRAQQLANIGTMSSGLDAASLLLIASMLIVFLYDEGAGLALLMAAAALYAGVPLLSSQVFALQGLHGTEASQEAMRALQTVGLIFGIPGLLWSVVDIVRRCLNAAEASRTRQASLRYAPAPGGRLLGTASKPHVTAYQRQQRTYRTLCIAMLVGEPALVALNLTTIQGWMQGLLALTARLSFSTNPAGIAQMHGSDGALVLWTLLIALNIVILAQLLRLLEFFCFRRPA